MILLFIGCVLISIFTALVNRGVIDLHLKLPIWGPLLFGTMLLSGAGACLLLVIILTRLYYGI